MKALFLTALAAACIAAPLDSVAQERAAQRPETSTKIKTFNAESFMLDNGMEVVVVPNDRVPVVTHMVWYKVGAADEPPGKSGIAHFLEHLLFKGSKQIAAEGESLPDLAPGEFSKIVRRLGGNDNAFTSHDYTAYFQSVPSQHLETVMRMEAGRMNGLQAPADEVLSERKVILEERKQRTDNDPRGQFGEQLSAAAFVNHPYGTPVIGWKHEMDALSDQDAMDFYKKWYAPNNAILVVSGDVSPARVFELAIEIYGQLPREDVPERLRTRSPVLNSKTSVSLSHPAIREPVVQTLYRVPSIRQDKETSYALEVLNEILSGGSSGRLYQSLVVQQKLASDAGISFFNSRWDDAAFYVYATPLPGVAHADVQDAYFEELRKVIDKGVTDDELRDAKMRMKDQAIYARDSLAGPAMVFGYSLAGGMSVDDVEYWPYDIEAVTASQIQEAARTYLNPDAPYKHPPVSGTLVPKGDAR